MCLNQKRIACVMLSSEIRKQHFFYQVFDFS